MSRLDAAVAAAFGALEREGSVERLAPALRACVVVVSAQGVIDNGGLEAFFGGDFPGRPPYGTFVDAYRAIGAEGAARALEEAVDLLGLEEAHLHRDARARRLAEWKARGAGEDPLERPDGVLCGSKEVWACLEAFVERHAEAFGLP